VLSPSAAPLVRAVFSLVPVAPLLFKGLSAVIPSLPWLMPIFPSAG
jgi:hypothetical protein